MPANEKPWADKIEAWRATDGSLHSSPEEAYKRSATNKMNGNLSRLIEEADMPADHEEIVRDFLRGSASKLADILI